jgi:hypothetical protein
MYNMSQAARLLPATIPSYAVSSSKQCMESMQSACLCLILKNHESNMERVGSLFMVPVICRAKFAPGDSDTESIHNLSQDSDAIVPTIKHNTM